MTRPDQTDPATDPFETWRQLYDANERAWTSALEQAMSSPEFGESSGKMLETMLAAQKAVRTNMRNYLESMNVPTREDIARLGELVIGLEEKVDQVADRLDAIEEAVRAATAAGATRVTPPAPPKAAPKPARPATRAKPARGVKPAKATP